VIEIQAAGAVAAPAASVFDHLADLRTHWQLTDGRVRLLDGGDGDPARGGRVRMRGPLGVGREARTEVIVAERPRLLEGRATIGPRTEARIRWRLEPCGEAATLVELSAAVTSIGAFDRALLALGGRIWLERLFSRAIGRLAALAPEISASPAAGLAAVSGAGR
jgi:hypothetical protein